MNVKLSSSFLLPCHQQSPRNYNAILIVGANNIYGNVLWSNGICAQAKRILKSICPNRLLPKALLVKILTFGNPN